MSDEKNLSSLPSHWQWINVGDLGKIITGNTPPKNNISNYGTYIPFVKPPELRNSVILKANDNLSEIGAKQARILPANSLLVSCIGILGKVGMNNTPVAFNQQINAIDFSKSDNYLPKFYFYFFQSSFAKLALEKGSSATTVAIINKSKFAALPVPYPPLDEQQRIVARIEALFTQLDAGVAALEAVRKQVKWYRQAVLQAAVSGKIFPNTVISYDTNLPVGWKKVQVSFIADVRLGRQRSPERAIGPYMTNYLRAANITWKGLALSDVKQMDFSPKECEVYALQTDDILLNEASGSIGEVGKPAIWNGEIENCCFQNTLLRVRSKGPLPKYLYYHFLCDAINEKFRHVAKGVGIHHLGAEGLSKWMINVPPIDQQNRIILEIERLFTIADQMEKSIDQSLRQAARLRQAILQRAFTGKL